jgi:hypothetical protein
MTVLCLTNGYVYLNGASNLSTFTTKIELNEEAAELDSTTMGSTWETVAAGLKKATLSLDFLDDYTVTTGLDAILRPLFGTSVAFEIRADGGSVTTSNPKWTGSVLISKYPVVVGGVGDLAKKSVTWKVNGAVTPAYS